MKRKKALILAAGLGTRLLPHTATRPKPLFTLNGLTVLQRSIEQLIEAGCSDIVINTHHLHKQIEQFVDECRAEGRFAIPLTTIHEPLILDTGGAIRNVQNFMGDDPFMVINSDIVSDIDLNAVWEFHLAEKERRADLCTTLVLHDHPIYNKIDVDNNLFVRSFSGRRASPFNQLLAFTGIQVLSPEIFDHIHNSKEEFRTAPFSSIELYSHLASMGDMVKAFVCRDIFWQDIGTPETYRDAAIRFAAAAHFKGVAENLLTSVRQVEIEKLAGDGSDRGWFRCRRSDNYAISAVIADHGISDNCAYGNSWHESEEIDSFIKIGNHLHAKGIAVPGIRWYDRFAGLVLLEDLGDLHLEEVVKRVDKPCTAAEWYKKVCSLAIDFSIKGIDGFDDSWTFQTPSYSKQMILEKECRYFVEAFLQRYLGESVQFDDFTDDFEFIAEHALEHAFEGLMHRDLQSRNIMVGSEDDSSLHTELFFIDFQSARRGPLQYDLASLLIDPYVNLSYDIQEELLYYCVNEVERIIRNSTNHNSNRYGSIAGYSQAEFIECYRYCALTRNMQMLGAFSHLSINRGKTFFQQYIPVALKNLKRNISLTDRDKTARLHNYIMNL